MSKATLILFTLLEVIYPRLAKSKPRPSEKRVFQIALVFDLSGKREPALDVVKGIEAAATKLNEAKDIEVEIKKYNSSSDAEGTRLAILQVIKDAPDIVIAEIDSSKAVIAAELLEREGRVMITPYATSPKVTEGRKYIFRTCFDDRFQGQRLATFAKDKLKATSAVIFYDGGELYSQTLAHAFRAAFEQSGGRVVQEKKILTSAVSFKDELDLATTAKADVIFLPVYEQTAARFINESVLRSGGTFTFLGGDGWGATKAFKDIVFRPDTSITGYWVSHYSGDFAKKSLKQVDDSFKRTVGVGLNASSAIGYDSMMIAAKALRRSGQTNPTQKQIAENLRTMSAYSGLTGSIHFGGKQDPEKSLHIRKIDRDKMGFETEVAP